MDGDGVKPFIWRKYVQLPAVFVLPPYVSYLRPSYIYLLTIQTQSSYEKNPTPTQTPSDLTYMIFSLGALITHLTPLSFQTTTNSTDMTEFISSHNTPPSPQLWLIWRI